MISANDLLRKGKELRWAKRFDESIEVFTEAARLAEKADGEGSQVLADCLSWLGLVYSLRSRDVASLTVARKYHERALEIETALYGEQDAHIADTLRLLGETLLGLGHVEASYEVLRRSAAIVRTLNLRTRSALDVLARLSDVAFELRQYDDAASAANEYLALPVASALSAWEEMSGHMRAGRALIEAGRASEAVKHFERNVDLALSLGREEGAAEMKSWLHKALAASLP